jgi:hypothetical protein
MEFSGILTFEYSGCLKRSIDVFYDADSKSSHMRQGKNATLRSDRQKNIFRLSGDQRSAKRFKVKRASFLGQVRVWH